MPARSFMIYFGGESADNGGLIIDFQSGSCNEVAKKDPKDRLKKAGKTKCISQSKYYSETIPNYELG